MATSLISQQQSSHTMMTQSYQREMSQQSSRSFQMKTPDGDLKDVEADFQSLVNEMVKDGGPTKRYVQQQEQRAFSSSSHITLTNGTPVKTSSTSSVASSSKSSSKGTSNRPVPLSFLGSSDPGVVTAMPARVIPATDYTERGGGESEVIIEKSMRVRDRVKKLEKQLSQEDLANSPVPEALMSPRYKSSSIKNLAEQFNAAQVEAASPVVNAQAFAQAKDSVELINNSEFRGVKQIASVFDKSEVSSQEDLSKKLEVEFKSVKETAAKYQEPIQVLPPPVRAAPPFRAEEEPVEEEIITPVAVLPPATMRKALSSPPPRPVMPSPAAMAPPIKSEEKTTAEDLRGFEEALSEMTKYSETLSTDSTESRSTSAETVVQQPIQYSAKVTCEVRSRVNTPEMHDLNPFGSSSSINQQSSKNITETKITRRSRSETRTSSTTGSTTSITSSGTRGAAAQQKTSSVSNTKLSSSSATHTPVAVRPTPSTSSSSAPGVASTGKPPRSDTSEGSKFSLLRSSSTGSVATDLRETRSMTRIGSEKELPKFNIKKIRPVAPRVWSPCRGDGGGRGEDRGPTKLELAEPPSFGDMPQVWTPSRAGSASPSLGRKEYRKVAYDGSTLRRRPSQENVSAPRPEESFAWRDQEAEKLKSGLPRSQNPTVTLLQKKREGQIPSRRPEYLQEESSLYKPSDKLYTIKREYESEDEDGSGCRRFAVLGPRKVEGVGPTTVEGVPVSLKTGIKSEHQGEWYRKMFDSLHKVKDDDFVTVKYKVPRVRYGSSGYMSEPEGYESDYGLSSRYSTLDRRGGRGGGYDWDPNDTLSRADPSYGTTDRNVKRYVHQPGRIEDYIPGFSSLSEKELRANPEVEFKIEAKGQDPPRGSSNHRYNPQRMQMSHALKETGYESDSTLVFRKQSERRPEHRDVSELYRQIQRGGEVPLEGLRKAAPRKPKDPVIGPLPFPYLAAGGYGYPRADSPFKYETSEVNIHYKTPVRLEQKDHIPDEELARRQEEHMRRVYEQERRKKYLAELEDIERRRHTDNFTPLQKSSPIPLNRYDDDPLGSRGSKQVARALFNFNAQNKRELSFSKGDIISVRRQIDKNWHEGELKGLVGIFPSNYVEILPAESFKSSSRKPSEGQARARFAFQAQTAMEMSFSKGETVVLTRRVDENWYEGRVGQQRRGIFPVSYVDVLVEPGDKGVSPSCSPLPRPALPASNVLYNGVPSTNSAYSTLSGGAATQATSIETRATYSQQLSVNTQQDTVPYRALYNYKPQNEDELELSEGDIVMVMEKCDDGWYVGTSRRTSLFGTFPGNYVERVA